MMMLITMMMMMNMTMKMTDLVAIASLRLAFHLVDCQVVQAVLVVVPHLGCGLILRSFLEDCQMMFGCPV